MTEKKEDSIVGRECRHVLHVPANKERPDLHLVKEVVHKSDGTAEPRLRWIKSFKRPFWVTSPQYRTHKQKKGEESVDRLMRRECTQSDLRDEVARALEVGYTNDHLRKLSVSPYLYGTEIRSTSLIKNEYRKKYPDKITPFTVMSFDIETDMVHGHEEPIIITAVMGKQIYLGVVDVFVQGIVDPETLYRAACKKYITEFTDLSTYELIFETSINTVELIRSAFCWIHQKKPDFLSIWNMDFDIPKILGALEKYRVDPRDILCDPSVPRSARICKYRQGLKKKKKANGAEIPIDPADQWHSLTLTASFYVIDAMCVYRLLRLAKQKESYSLDAVLNRALGARKLKFEQAEAYKKGAWHVFMQTHYKIEYLAYAAFDSLSMDLLDQKTLDLRTRFPSYAGCTDFARSNSKPKLIADALHFYAIEKGYVLNSVAEEVDPEELEEGEEEDPEVMSLDGWILTLHPHMSVLGLPLLEESPTSRTLMRAMVYDSDTVSAYPAATSMLNVSKTTTRREIVTIHGVDEKTFRLQNINLCSGAVNSLEYCQTMFRFPSVVELDALL